MRPEVRMMISALDADDSPRSGWCMVGDSGLGWRPAEPREVFIVGAGWVSEDASRLSGWIGDRHFSSRPRLLDRWRLRRAVQRWVKRRSVL